MIRRRRQLRVPALLGGALLLFGGAVDAWGVSVCAYHGHEHGEGPGGPAALIGAPEPAHEGHAHHHAHDEHAHHGHPGTTATSEPPLTHAPEGHALAPSHTPESDCLDPGVARATLAPGGHAHGHGEECDCRLRCVAVGALPPLEPEVISVADPPPPNESVDSPVELRIGVHAPATVPYLLPFSQAPPTHA